MNEIIPLQYNLTLLEIKGLHIFFDKSQGKGISEDLNFNKKEVSRIINKIKVNWNVKSDIGLVMESLKRGYYDLSYKMDHANLYHWSGRTEMTNALRVAISRYLHFRDIETVTIGEINADEFIGLDGVNSNLWKELDSLRIASSKKITSFNVKKTSINKSNTERQLKS